MDYCFRFFKKSPSLGIHLIMKYWIFLFLNIFGSTATAGQLKVGTCIADKFLCNAHESDIDPWEIECFGGAFLKIEKIGKRSYKTSCFEQTLQCKKFVSFKDIDSIYFEIKCSDIEKLRNAE